MKRDYSEYQYDGYDYYRAIRSNSSNLRYNFFHNYAFFEEEHKRVFIYVDPNFEMDIMRKHLVKYEEEVAARNKEDFEAYKEQLKYSRLTAEMLNSENPQIMKDLSEHYGDKVRFAIQLRQYKDFYTYWPPVNLLSGSTLVLPYGEGLLDFLYADFKTPINDLIQLLKELEDKQEEEEEESDDTQKVHNFTEEFVQDYFNYVLSFYWFHKVLYKSLYTAACPPVIEGALDQRKVLRRYALYLLALQDEYTQMMQFCYDESFFPNILGRMMPHERYTLYRSIHQLKISSERKEVLRVSYNLMGHKSEMPFGMTQEEYLARTSAPVTIPQEEEEEFLKAFHTTKEKIYNCIQSPAFLSVHYAFSTVEQMLELEFTKMLEQNVRFRKCKRCGKYFIMKGNYDTNYCDRVAEGETRTCQQIASQENYRARNADNKALPIYNKYYKRYAARVKVKQIKEKDFNAWRYQAIRKRDECSAGKLTPEEYTEWMEASFPNRKPRKKKDEASE